MTQTQQIENMLIVTAVEGYAYRHNLKPMDAWDIFAKYNVNKDIRDCYDTLHTQSLDETVYFAEDILKRKAK
jgi:hypothetical protein